MILWIIIVGLIALWFFRTLHLKVTHPYEGRHSLGNVIQVPATYHPSDSAWVPAPVKNRAWWNARLGRRYHERYLFMPLRDFWERKEEQYQAFLEWLGSNYRWTELPYQYWPDEWKIPSVDLAGSDLPPRALTVVRDEEFKPARKTLALRMAA